MIRIFIDCVKGFTLTDMRRRLKNHRYESLYIIVNDFVGIIVFKMTDGGIDSYLRGFCKNNILLGLRSELLIDSRGKIFKPQNDLI